MDPFCDCCNRLVAFCNADPCDDAMDRMVQEGIALVERERPGRKMVADAGGQWYHDCCLRLARLCGRVS